MVHCEPGTERLRWQHVNVDTLRRTNKGFAIDLPEESDLRTALAALQALAKVSVPPGPSECNILLVPYSFEHGVLTNKEELGLAALAFSRSAVQPFSRSALRGDACSVEVEMDGEAELVASIDAIRDMVAPTAEQRLDAIIRADILDRYRKHARALRRALSLLLTEPLIADTFGYQNQLLATAIHRTAPPSTGNRLYGEIRLQAWPGHHMEWPVVSFEIPSDALDDFFARDNMNR